MLLERVVLGQKVRAELLLRGGDLLVDLLKPCLGGLLQIHTVAGETLVELLENHLLLSRKSALVSVIDSLDTLEERLVHRDVVLVLGHQRGGLLDNFVHLIAAFCLLKVEQHGRRLGQSLAGQLVSRHGVLKGRSLLIAQDGLKFLVLLLNPGAATPVSPTPRLTRRCLPGPRSMSRASLPSTRAMHSSPSLILQEWKSLNN